MDISQLKKIKLNVWYRGLKEIEVLKVKDNKVLMTNKDVFEFNDENIFLNNKLICNDEITANDLIDLYIYKLKQKGYKIL